MATTPVTPVVRAESWLKHHERLLIVLMVLLAGGWAYSKYADLSASKAETRAQVAEQTLAAQKAQDAQNAATTASVLAQYQAMVTTLSAQNASLAAAAAQRQVVLKQNQATDSTLALPALAKRLETLGNVPDGQVSTAGDSVKITQSGTVAVVQMLETIPVLQADLKDQTTLADAAQAAQKQGDTVIADQAKQITGLNLTIKDEETQCKAQVAVVKAQARKSKLRWFKLGFLLGFGSGAYLGHAAHL